VYVGDIGEIINRLAIIPIFALV